MHKAIKLILKPFSGLSRETKLSDFKDDCEYLADFCIDFPELDELKAEHEQFIAWEEDHDAETLAVLNLHDTGLFIDHHRDELRKDAKQNFKGLL